MVGRKTSSRLGVRFVSYFGPCWDTRLQAILHSQVLPPVFLGDVLLEKEQGLNRNNFQALPEGQGLNGDNCKAATACP